MSGLRIVGWGPFRLPGEKRRMREAQEYAEKVMRARRELRERDDAVFDVPESGQIFIPGDKVNVTRADGTTQRYEVTKGDSPDTVWVNPHSPRQFEMKRVDPDA